LSQVRALLGEPTFSRIKSLARIVIASEAKQSTRERRRMCAVSRPATDS